MTSAFWRDRPVLVTGATGLLGSWLVKALLTEEAQPVCLMRDWVPQSELVRSGSLDQVHVVRGDVCDQALLERVLGEYEVATVFHLAAQTIVTIAKRNPVSTFQTNILGTTAVLEACRRSPAVRQVIVASSDKAYGEAESLPYGETTALQGIYPYDVSKSCADLIARSYALTFGLPVAITRCGNFYGGGDLNWNRIIPGTIRSILRGEQPVIRSDGEYLRDYFYIEDGASAYMQLAEQLAETPALCGEAFNFSNEEPETVIGIVHRLLEIMQSDLDPVILNETTHEIRRQYLSAQKAHSLLGWQPHFTLETGLRKTVAWYQEFFHGG